eukprot:jgi/Mesvir1/4181/Mv08895-RA.2
MWADADASRGVLGPAGWPRDIETGDAPQEGSTPPLPVSLLGLLSKGSLYALCSRIRVGLGGLASLTGNVELDSLAGLGEHPGILRNLGKRARRRAVLRKQLPALELSAEAHWNGRFVDAHGTYYDVPRVLSADLRSRRGAYGVRYRVGVHSMCAPETSTSEAEALVGPSQGAGASTGHAMGTTGAGDRSGASPLRTGTHVQAALTIEREKMLWRKAGPPPSEPDNRSLLSGARSALSRVSAAAAVSSAGSSLGGGASTLAGSAGMAGSNPSSSGLAGTGGGGAGASSGGTSDALVTSSRSYGASDKKHRPRLMPYGSLCGWPRITVGAMVGVLARAPLPHPLRPLDALTHDTSVGAFSSVGITARMGTFSKAMLDFTSVSLRLDTSTAMAPTLSGGVAGRGWPSHGSSSSLHSNGEAGAPPMGLPLSSSLDRFHPGTLPDGADPVLAGSGASTSTLWGGAPPRRVMTTSLTQQLVGPVRARVDARFDLDRAGDGAASGGGNTQGLLDLNYCLDCLLGPGGPARVCLWYSPIQKQAMAELRMLEL